MQRKYSILAILCTMLVCVLCNSPKAYASGGYSAEDSMDAGNVTINLKKWMSAIPNNITLSQLSIPGTHDSMSFHGKTLIDKPWVQTQRAVLPRQLDSGIRYLDIRIRDTGDSFAIHHGEVYQQAMFGDVLNDVTNFLKNNPTETIFMRVKNEHEQDLSRYESIFESYWNSYKSYFWNGTSKNPTLGEIRGKIVVLQDFPSNKQYGIPYGTLDIQDDWDVPNLEKKWSAVKQQIDHTNTASDINSIHLNHLSGTHYNLTSGNTPEGVAKYINPRAVSYIKNNKGINLTGIVAADFPDTVFVNSIIYKNYLYNHLATDEWYANSVQMDICTKQRYPQSCVEDMDPSYRTHDMYETINRLVEEDTLNEQTNWSGDSYNFVRFNYIILPGQEKNVLNKLNAISKNALSIRQVLKILNGYHNNTNSITSFTSTQQMEINGISFPMTINAPDSAPATLNNGVYTDQVNNYPTWVQLGVYNKFKVISQHNPAIWNKLKELGFSLNDQTKEVILK